MNVKEELKTQNNAIDIINQPSCTEFISVPSFPLKAYEIVSDSTNEDIVRWTKEGDAFIILNENQFSDKVLPKYFKTKKFTTFIRQLNIYGFRKTKYMNEELCFTHKDFRRDNKRLLLNMKRKTSKNKHSEKRSSSSESSYITREEVMQLFGEVNKKLNDQQQQIEKLNQANSEFKNSVLALYAQLEKSKERELHLEKLLSDNQLGIGNGPPPIYDDILNDHMREECSTGSMSLKNQKELYKLLASFISNFVQSLGKNDLQNLYSQKNGSKFKYYPRATANVPSNNEFLPFNVNEYKNNMLENGPL